MKTTVVVVVEKGMVMELFANDPRADVVVIDLDTEEPGVKARLRADVEDWRGILHAVEAI